MIYYSGHGGYQKSTATGFWIAYDSKNEDFSTWINNAVILSYIKQIAAKHIFLISDSCFSRTILLDVPTKSILADVKDYDFYKSRWALTSGAEESKDGSPGENSLFGESIINILKVNNEELRVSKLIEEVKDVYKVNVFQKPQGYPLNDPNHKGGELILKANEEIEYTKQVKGYKDLLTILQLYQQNTAFKELGEFENKTQRIGYQIFQENDKVKKKVTNYLYLYEGIVQQKTYDHIRTRFPEIFKDKSLIILIPKEKDQKLLEKRKNNIRDKFQPLNIFYIDDFIRDQCTPNNFAHRHKLDDKYLGIHNFVVPHFEYEKHVHESPSFFQDWLEHENEPILVIKGEGGIGKTTMAQFIADKYLKLNTDAFVLFIDSSEVIAKLTDNVKNRGNISLYNFYEATHDRSESIINEDLFRLNLDAGNFLLIIDGLDEVISKLPFNVEEFLNSIIEYTSELGNGKTVIACRSYFWEKSNFPSGKIKAVEILPFNINQTRVFFEKSFGAERRKIDKGLKIVEEFKFTDERGESSYHPYVLDVVRAIVESDQDILQSDNSFTTSILERSVKNDYIIYRICYRERLRVEQISVDEQLDFFLYWSIKRRGVISLENFGIELKEALKKHIDDNTIEAFKSHPFIDVADSTIRFKYDFFADYFKSIFISRHLCLDSVYHDITSDFLKIIIENCWYGSSMITDIKNRVMHWSDNELLKCSDIIEQIKVKLPDDINGQRKSIAGFFNICLAINIKFNSNSIEKNTYLVKALFSKISKEIHSLHIINMHSNDETIRFNFEDTTLYECFIDNFEAFWKCAFNDSTFFVNSHFDKKIKIPKHNFQNCFTDTKFNNVFKKEEVSNHNASEHIRDFLQGFFGLFYARGMMQPQTISKPHKGTEHHPPLNKKYASVANNFFDFEDVITFMKKEGVIEVYSEFAEEKVKITSVFKNDSLKFIKDGTVSKGISNLIGKLLTMYSN